MIVRECGLRWPGNLFPAINESPQAPRVRPAPASNSINPTRKSMPLLQVFKFPHPMLKKQAKTVTRFDDDLRRLGANMLDTMYEEGGIGLAANQVGQLKQMVVMDLRAEDEEDAEKPRPGRKKDPRVFVNPTMLESGGEIVTEEGCLSVVDFTADVKRKQWIRVAYQTAEGEIREEAF